MKNLFQFFPKRNFLFLYKNDGSRPEEWGVIIKNNANTKEKNKENKEKERKLIKEETNSLLKNLIPGYGYIHSGPEKKIQNKKSPKKKSPETKESFVLSGTAFLESLSDEARSSLGIKKETMLNRAGRNNRGLQGIVDLQNSLNSSGKLRETLVVDGLLGPKTMAAFETWKNATSLALGEKTKDEPERTEKNEEIENLKKEIEALKEEIRSLKTAPQKGIAPKEESAKKDTPKEEPKNEPSTKTKPKEHPSPTVIPEEKTPPVAETKWETQDPWTEKRTVEEGIKEIKEAVNKSQSNLSILKGMKSAITKNPGTAKLSETLLSEDYMEAERYKTNCAELTTKLEKLEQRKNTFLKVKSGEEHYTEAEKNAYHDKISSLREELNENKLNLLALIEKKITRAQQEFWDLNTIYKQMTAVGNKITKKYNQILSLEGIIDPTEEDYKDLSVVEKEDRDLLNEYMENFNELLEKGREKISQMS